MKNLTNNKHNFTLDSTDSILINFITLDQHKHQCATYEALNDQIYNFDQLNKKIQYIKKGKNKKNVVNQFITIDNTGIQIAVDVDKIDNQAMVLGFYMLSQISDITKHQHTNFNVFGDILTTN